MRYTTNYNMVIGEGTDAVNPLTQIFPNFETIDAAMEANKEGGITTASEVTTGSVHAIVRVNTSVPIFRFTATSAWTTGDTMTLDGSAVTVHLADGTSPLSGTYVIGAEVVAVVNASLVTLLTSSTFDGVKSFNSRNGIVLPQNGDYTANMIGYNNTLSGLTSTDAQGAIDEIASVVTSPDVMAVNVTGIPGTGALAGLIPAGYIPVGGVVTSAGSVTDPTKAYTALVGGLSGTYYCLLQMLGGAGTQVSPAADTVVRMMCVKAS